MENISGFTRRSFIGAMAALPLLDWLHVDASAQTPLVRYDVWSVEGKAMLKLYAKAVAIMNDPAQTPESSALSWLFQWYTHAVPLDTTNMSRKPAELTRVYGSATAPAAALANDMWDTCQAHHPTSQQELFLPWHRLYLYYFERIVRKVCGDNAFTLPYWNYSDAAPARHGVLPPEFRLPNDATFKSLYRARRNTGSAVNQLPKVNGGEPIDKYASGALDGASLKQGSYLPHGALEGLNLHIDQHIHGNVHGLVGDRTNMGRVPTAAGDPVFWLHHCNVDRLWASWNKNGGKNPASIAGLSFVFADDNGAKPTKPLTIGEVYETGPLGYTYQALEPAPPGFVPLPDSTAAPPSTTLMTTKPIGSGSLEAPFEMTAAMPTSAALRDRVANLPARRRFYLLLRSVQASGPTSALYNVYLGLPAGVPAAARNQFKAGTINFFGASHAGQTAAPGRFYSFDVTEVLRMLGERQALVETPKVTVLPISSADGDVTTRVEGVTLIEQ